MSKVFLYRVKNSNDRDCCAYLENNPVKFECGHYFSRIILHGACYCNSDFEAFSEIETILTEAEYEQLLKIDAEIGNMGYGITPEDERYKRGMELVEAIKPIMEKLNSAAAQDFYQKIVAEEKEIVMDDYDLTEEEVNTAFENYPLAADYQDRSIIGSIFADAEELGEEEAYSCGYISNNNSVLEKYFDFEKFGRDLVDEDENYFELPDGRCVCYMM